jgi:hypothetical protein
MPESIYVIVAQFGNCRVCGKHDDLRFGSCFECSDYVNGEQISLTTHRLWDSRNPSNEWFVEEAN